MTTPKIISNSLCEKSLSNFFVEKSNKLKIAEMKLAYPKIESNFIKILGLRMRAVDLTNNEFSRVSELVLITCKFQPTIADFFDAIKIINPTKYRLYRFKILQNDAK